MVAIWHQNISPHLFLVFFCHRKYHNIHEPHLAILMIHLHHHVSSTQRRSCPVPIIMTTSWTQTHHGDPFIGPLREWIHLDAIGHMEFHLKSSVRRRLCRGTSTLYVEVPYLPWSAAQFGDTVDPMLIRITHLLVRVSRPNAIYT